MSRLILGLLLLTVCCLLVTGTPADEEEQYSHPMAKRRMVVRVPSMVNPDSDHLLRILNRIAFAEQKQKKLADFFYDGYGF